MPMSTLYGRLEDESGNLDSEWEMVNSTGWPLTGAGVAGAGKGPYRDQKRFLKNERILSLSSALNKSHTA